MRQTTLKKNHLKQLVKLFMTPKTSSEMEAFLDDILTPAEIDDLHLRWCIIEQLISGKTQRQVQNALDISISKVTRGAQTLKYGRGGFEIVHKRLRKPNP